MKKLVCVTAVVGLLSACGPSDGEVKQKVIDISAANVCDCYEVNKNDWLAYQKCKTRVETGRILLADDPEGLADFENRVKDCDQYFKD